MLKSIIVGLTAAALVMPVAAQAAAPVVKPGKGRGIVVIEVTGIAKDPTKLFGITDMNLHIAWFDKARRKPYLESEFLGAVTTDVQFELATTAAGHSYLIASPYAGRSLFYMFSAQTQWEMCLNAGTVSFYIPEDRYTFLGRFDPTETRLQIEQAVMNGKMPNVVKHTDNIPTLLDGYLTGFTPPSTDAADVARIEADMAEIYGAPIEIGMGVSEPVTFDLSHYEFRGKERTACFEWSSKKQRPQGFNGFKE
ncbi:MAG: hypothetical protein QM667_10640 [Asticcacaulis sp.]